MSIYKNLTQSVEIKFYVTISICALYIAVIKIF